MARRQVQVIEEGFVTAVQEALESGLLLRQLHSLLDTTHADWQDDQARERQTRKE